MYALFQFDNKNAFKKIVSTPGHGTNKLVYSNYEEGTVTKS